MLRLRRKVGCGAEGRGGVKRRGPEISACGAGPVPLTGGGGRGCWQGRASAAEGRARVLVVGRVG